MLNKDQYNQDEYNDYYRQETEGAEIKGSYKKSGNNKTIFILLGLLLLGIAGYFGFKMFKASTPSDSTEEKIKTIATNETPIEKIKEEPTTESKNIVVKSDEIVKSTEAEKPSEEVEKPKKEEKETHTDSVETEVATVIEKSSSSQKMSPEEIADVVKLVMMQMNKKSNDSTDKSIDTNRPIKSDNENKASDTDLLNALSETEVDSITESKKADYSKIETKKNVKVNESTKTINTYNKVTIQTTSGDDELSKLSEQISSVIQDTTTIGTSSNKENSSSENNYRESITKEVATRSNAMRFIIVRKGDTLGKIAKRAYGNVMDYKRIYDANPDLIRRPDRIYVGQKLHIPK